MYLKQKKKKSVEESEEESEEKIKDDFKKIIEYIENGSKSINYDFFKDYFDFSVPSALAKRLYKTKYKKKTNNLVEQIKSRWSDLKDEIKKMSEDETEIEQSDKILKIVEEVLDFNTRI